MFEALLNPSYLLFAVISILVSVFWRQAKKHLPPGPTALPIIGNILQLRQGDVLDIFRQYRKEYGDIFTVQLGSYTTVVINGYDNLKEIFGKRGDEFSDRPHIFIHDELSRQKGRCN